MPKWVEMDSEEEYTYTGLGCLSVALCKLVWGGMEGLHSIWKLRRLLLEIFGSYQECKEQVQRQYHVWEHSGKWSWDQKWWILLSQTGVDSEIFWKPSFYFTFSGWACRGFNHGINRIKKNIVFNITIAAGRLVTHIKQIIMVLLMFLKSTLCTKSIWVQSLLGSRFPSLLIKCDSFLSNSRISLKQTGYI